ncbi:uncharacterized protein SPPG_02633 [Spizellomyces punctatus DAOM BR117]|uniref:Phosphatidylethanolamine N-methyltransferase n=1 Tax=Spizellomyces punctatus (strain DAOM BR117) TaxID=645134 RepID=A0A0L0HMW1_SPIPD|nr:uncharacterized protein SPPG_02633 [Spizellomyces punctatus DAOM BR117]KND02139.1 hypothetical protein SPPG_02633 [Spizellomyces punctatus DAOM BR117]|eukprot:XP_016610178.1 hypothetical protein SPPG_02633 [Spizellomyces punctatus DAOM BR117]
MGSDRDGAVITPPDSPPRSGAETGDICAMSKSSSCGMPSITSADGLAIKGLKVPDVPPNTPASKEAILAASEETTVGRVPDGTVFSVPQTHDLIQTLFSPKEPKTLPEWITLGAMAFEISLFLFTNTPRGVFLCFFIFWRCMYNFGLGVLLSAQSRDRALVRWAKRIGLQSNPTKPRTWWAQFLVNQVKRKMSKDVQYNYETMPIEFNVWILYRGLVDVILVNDFTCYVLFAISFYQYPEGGHGLKDVLRYAGGVLMLLFNLWVKTDAHRVVKDFAWYWGDFFFLVDASLTFDGVFEMAPHPMYSVGYIGFYGTALIAQSYWVLFISLAAHAAQMAFLHWVENPHIDKTYNPPTQKTEKEDRELMGKYFRRDMTVFRNLDWFRSTDLQTITIAAYTVLAAILIGPIDGTWKLWFYVGQTLFWRVVHTYGLGAILYLQSNFRLWNRHFIKYGDSPREAFHHWKVIYNTTQLMTYVSFFICAIRLFVVPENVVYGTFLLRATLGVLFILLHLWIAISTFEVIGSSGWFYGDFFIDELRARSGPVYSGLYRYLDNPLLYTFSCWGVAMICGSPVLYAITLFGQVSNWLFLRYVEQPHMRRMYGSKIRREAGVERVLKSKVGELERNAKGAVEKMVKDLDLVDVLNRIKLVKRQGEQELRKVMGPEAWKEFVARARGRKGVRRVGTDVTPPESEEDDYIAEEDDGSTVGREGLRLRKKTSQDSQSSSSSHEDETATRQVAARGRRDANRNLPQAVERIIEELEDLVDQAKPRVRAMVGETTLKFAQLAKVGEELPVSRLPVHLYRLEFPFCATGSPVTFTLGQPITIEFVSVAEAMTSRDWIGLYPVTANPNSALTTTKSSGRWLFITGHAKTEWDIDGDVGTGRGISLVKKSNGKSWIGQTEVKFLPAHGDGITADAEDLHLVRGQLTFHNDQLPWRVGVYEARYHYEGKYGVVTASRAFEIVAEEFSWQEAESTEAEDDRIVDTLRRIVENCLDIDVVAGGRPLGVDDDILERVKVDGCLDGASYAKYKEEVAKRITYVTKQTFGIEFSWKVIGLVGTVGGLAKRISSARVALHPPPTVSDGKNL